MGWWRRSELARIAALLVALCCVSVAFAAAPVVVLLSDRDDARATQMADGFRVGAGYAVLLSYQLGPPDDLGFDLAETGRQVAPAMVFAIGDRALKLAARELPNVPVVYTDVVDPSILGDRKDVIGVTPRADPFVFMPHLRQALPLSTRIGVIRPVGESGGYWDDLVHAGAGLGFEVVFFDVAAVDEVSSAVRLAARRTDLLLLQHQPALWNAESVSAAITEAHQRRFPLVGFGLDQVSGAPAACMALVGNPPAVGLAAADVATQLLVEQLSPGLVVLPRLAPLLVGNRRALRHARVPLDKRTTQVFDSWAEDR